MFINGISDKTSLSDLSNDKLKNVLFTGRKENIKTSSNGVKGLYDDNSRGGKKVGDSETNKNENRNRRVKNGKHNVKGSKYKGGVSAGLRGLYGDNIGCGDNRPAAIRGLYSGGDSVVRDGSKKFSTIKTKLF